MNNLTKRILLVIFIIYASIFISGLFFAEKVLFQPHPSSYKDTPEILKFTTRDGNKISALYLANPTAKFTLLVSHGNAEDLGDDRDWLEDLRKSGFSVLAFDYQGYGTSEGKPSEKASYDDENAAYDYLTLNLKISSSSIIIFGRSVGSGPAVYLAARRPAAGLILQSPFISAFRVLTRIPILPFDKFPNARDIRRVRCPVLIMHGTEDRVIGFWHGQRLYDLANGPKRSLWVQGADHNDFDMVAGRSYGEALQQFAALVTETDKALPASTP